ncbi:TRAP transporter small permease [Xanthobacteraceae bacterium Astr-EGSB]|uniref:TRAP transporter small permease n=1 Tax=Astrobacterium formosum TaxID=3069710 RepID=UPI0027B67973|nr:TRAP transporter small permease [Xanthobacteraceae bacterium Astr-EGSB]
MQRFAHIVDRVMVPVDKLADALVILIFVAMLASGFGQIFNRSLLNASLSWSEEFQRYGHIWLVFLTIPVAYRHGRHIGIMYVFECLGERRSRFLYMFIDVVWLLLGLAISVNTLRLIEVAQYQTSPGLDVPMSWPYAGMLIGGVYLVATAAHMLLSRLAASLAPLPIGPTSASEQPQ